jgi:hypothetical protein
MNEANISLEICSLICIDGGIMVENIISTDVLAVSIEFESIKTNALLDNGYSSHDISIMSEDEFNSAWSNLNADIDENWIFEVKTLTLNVSVS